MSRMVKKVVLFALTLAGLQFSCTTALGTALRDAAIGGAASFVEQATGEILSDLFDPTQLQE